MNLLYVYDDHLGSGCHRFIYFNEKSLLNRAVIMSSRVFYIDSYENLKIGSVWVPNVHSMKTRRSTVLGG